MHYKLKVGIYKFFLCWSERNCTLYSLKSILLMKSIQTLYLFLYQAMYQCGIKVWCDITDNALKPLKIQQNHIIRICLKNIAASWKFAKLDRFKIIPHYPGVNGRVQTFRCIIFHNGLI